MSSSDLLELVVEASAEGIAVIDNRGRIQLWNASAEALTMVSSAAVVSKHFSEFVPDELAAVIACGLGSGDEASPAGALVCRWQEGSRPTRIRWRPLIDKTGARRGIELSFRAAHNDPGRYAALIRDSNEAIFSHEVDGTITTWNQGARRLYGYCDDEILGSSICILVPADLREEIDSLQQRVLAGEFIAPFETERVHKEGHRLAVTVSFSPIRDEAGNVVGFSKTDRDSRDQVTQRRRLQESEERYRATFNEAAVGVAHVDLDGSFLDVNPRLAKILGYSREECLGLRVQNITHPDDCETSLQAMRSLRSGSLDNYQGETRYVCKDGSVQWMLQSAALVRGEDGAPLYFVHMAEDIAERKRLAAALRESETRMRVACRIAKVGSFEWHIPTNVNIWTPELEALYGLPPGAFSGSYEAWRECVHPEDIAPAERQIQVAMKTGGFHGEWRAIWPDGSIRWLEARAWVERDEHDQPLRMIGVNLDVTERRRAEEAVRNSEEQYRLALEGGELGSWSYDIAAQTGSWDERAAMIFGSSVEEGMTMDQAMSRLHPDDLAGAQQALDACIRTGESYHLTHRVITDDDKTQWVRSWGRVMGANPTEGKAGRIVGVVQDITAQVVANEELETASQRKDDYLAMLSHELRNPLAAIRTAGEVLHLENRNSIVGENKPLRRAADVLERQTAHMGKLLDGLLDVSRINRGKLSLERAPIELTALLVNLISDHQRLAELRGITLSLIEHGGPISLKADAARLTQVFDNLISNALKFTEKGGQVLVSVDAREGQQVVVRVEDSGIGFEPNSTSDLFEMFHQGPQDLARKNGGLGLGLYLARAIVEMHKGSIRAHSEGLNQGAIVEVCLPTRISAPKARKNQLARPAATVSEKSTLGILLIEDNDDAAELLSELLTQAGNEVTVASHAGDGIRLASEIGPDVVLCDIGLPGDLTGYDVAKTLRTESQAGPYLVALTGYGRPEDKARCVEAGFHEHLTKPVAVKQVLESLGRARAFHSA